MSRVFSRDERVFSYVDKLKEEKIINEYKNSVVVLTGSLCGLSRQKKV